MAHTHTGTAHKVVSVILRIGELCCAVIVLGLLSRFCYLISIAQESADGRIVYAMVVGGIGIIYSFFFCPPFKSLFLSFPFDFVLFVMWLVAYCLLQTVWLSLPIFMLFLGEDHRLINGKIHFEQRTGSHTCSSRWYYDYWGYYWGRFWRVGPVGTVSIDRAGCAQWRTVLAFSFIAWFLHVTSGILVSNFRVPALEFKKTEEIDATTSRGYMSSILTSNSRRQSATSSIMQKNSPTNVYCWIRYGQFDQGDRDPYDVEPKDDDIDV
ncbi:hypothetical protein AUP68_18088 [Ilyonectria robusta]